KTVVVKKIVFYRFVKCDQCIVLVHRPYKHGGVINRSVQICFTQHELFVEISLILKRLLQHLFTGAFARDIHPTTKRTYSLTVIIADDGCLIQHPCETAANFSYAVD